jgi:hypothetical protein
MTLKMVVPTLGKRLVSVGLAGKGRGGVAMFGIKNYIKIAFSALQVKDRCY